MGLKIRNVLFREKFTEINLRQRKYMNDSFITVIMNCEFYPSLVEKSIISGSIEVKLDVKDISSLDDLVGNIYKGDIGSVVISVNNNGIWESQSYDLFEIEFKSRNGREIEFVLSLDECSLETTGVVVSLYSTSSSVEELDKCFDLSEFYDEVVEKEIAGKRIVKYFFKG